MNRSKAALIHLAISSTALLVLICVTLFVWYTYPHYKYEGVLEILTLIALVDVIIGPVLTFVVVKPGKALKEIRSDLAIIAVIQIAAFGYGTWAIESQHPEFLLYADGTFTTIPSSQVDFSQIEETEVFKKFHVGPTLVTFKQPEDPLKQAEIALAFVTEGKTLADFPQYFASYPPAAKELESSKIELELLYQNDERRELIEAFLEKEQLQPDDVYFFPLVSFLQNSLLVISQQTLMPVGYLDVRPAR